MKHDTQAGLLRCRRGRRLFQHQAIIQDVDSKVTKKKTTAVKMCRLPRCIQLLQHFQGSASFILVQGIQHQVLRPVRTNNISHSIGHFRERFQNQVWLAVQKLLDVRDTRIQGPIVSGGWSVTCLPQGPNSLFCSMRGCFAISTNCRARLRFRNDKLSYASLAMLLFT